MRKHLPLVAAITAGIVLGVGAVVLWQRSDLGDVDDVAADEAVVSAIVEQQLRAEIEAEIRSELMDEFETASRDAEPASVAADQPALSREPNQTPSAPKDVAAEEVAATEALHPSVAAEAERLMEQIVVTYEAPFPFLRTVYDAAPPQAFDERQSNPCGNSQSAACVQSGTGGVRAWISLDALKGDHREFVFLHEMAHVLDHLADSRSSQLGNYRSAATDFRAHYAGCRRGGNDAERTSSELLTDAVARLVTNHRTPLSLGMFLRNNDDFAGCLADTEVPDDLYRGLARALLDCTAPAAVNYKTPGGLFSFDGEHYCSDEEIRVLRCQDGLLYAGFQFLEKPGWEPGCETYIPDSVECIAASDLGNVLLPGRLETDGSCTEIEDATS